MTGKRRTPVSELDHPWRKLVSDDCRGFSSLANREFLRSPENLAEWRRALNDLKRDVEVQFEERAALVEGRKIEASESGDANSGRDFREYRSKYLRWRGSARRFLALVEFRIEEQAALAHKASGAIAANEHVIREMLSCALEQQEQGNMSYEAYERLKTIAGGDDDGETSGGSGDSDNVGADDRGSRVGP
jgi:hypothetical protein